MRYPALGIDLGTTYCVVAALDGHGEAVVLRNQLGEETTPSVVCFESAGTVLVGTAARDASPIYPDRTVALIKRQMGTDGILAFDGVEYTPESVSALILRALVEGALPDRTPGEPVRAVVTVPAYFGIREREATQQACLLAGLDVLELVSEPVAAAVHYGFGGRSGTGTALVYDLGGGTFDATLLALDGDLTVVGTDGDTELGGADWDRRLVSYLLDRFVELTGPASDPADDSAFLAELALAAEWAKRALSLVASHRIALRYGGVRTTVTLTRDAFEAMTADLVDRSLGCVRRLLAATGRTAIDHVLLVGGSSRMPMVAHALAAELGVTPQLHDPDLAVAKGAAVRAHQIVAAAGAVAAAPTGLGSARPLASVVPRSFGLLVADSFEASGQRRFVQHVIHQNDPLPVDAGEWTVGTILDDQHTVRIEVYEQAGAVESAELADNRRVLDGELSGLPRRLPAGAPIRVTLRLGLDGRLSVTAVEPSSGATLALEACIEGVLDTAGRDRLATQLGRLAVRQ